jgi:predicted RNase H-like nuclease (RuvC/YqgF family)
METAPKGVQVKIRMLEQMAESLEDQVSGLYRRAATFEEEEYLLNREIEERQTEINRLTLKLETMQVERDRVMDKIELISKEACAMREKIIDHEEEFAIASIENAGSHPAPIGGSNDPRFADSEQSPGPMFFRRLTLSEAVTQPLDAKLLS